MRYYIYDRFTHAFVNQVTADSPEEALKAFASEMGLDGYKIEHRDCLKMPNGYCYSATKMHDIGIHD